MTEIEWQKERVSEIAQMIGTLEYGNSVPEDAIARAKEWGIAIIYKFSIPIPEHAIKLASIPGSALSYDRSDIPVICGCIEADCNQWRPEWTNRHLWIDADGLLPVSSYQLVQLDHALSSDNAVDVAEIIEFSDRFRNAVKLSIKRTDWNLPVAWEYALSSELKPAPPAASFDVTKGGVKVAKGLAIYLGHPSGEGSEEVSGGEDCGPFW